MCPLLPMGTAYVFQKNAGKHSAHNAAVTRTVARVGVQVVVFPGSQSSGGADRQHHRALLHGDVRLLDDSAVLGDVGADELFKLRRAA